MDISFMAMNRIVERKMASDPAYAAEIRAAGRPVLSDLWGMAEEALLAEAQSLLGHDLDRQSFSRLATELISAEEVWHRLGDRKMRRREKWDEDRLWMILALLWERWLPEMPSCEMLDNLVQAGYDKLGQKDDAEACRIWLRAWPVLLKIMDRAGETTIEGLDERFSGSQFMTNWVQDLETYLWNGGMKDPGLFREGIRYCEEYLDRFGAADQLVAENMRRAIGQFLAALGEDSEADRRFTEWLEKDRAWGWGWIGWSDCYGFSRKTHDLPRAGEILRRGVAIPGVRDVPDILDRLARVCEESGKAAEAEAIRSRISRSNARGEFSGEATDVAPERGSAAPIRRTGSKIGRNDPCPCGSGKKYKKCCGR